MKFNSKKLQAIFEKAQPILENLKPQDALNEDIHELEVFLKTLHLKDSFVFNLRFANTPAYQEELLVWNHKIHALIYSKNSYKVSCLAHDKGYYQHINYNDKEIIMEVPLREAPFDIKKHIANEDKLALFLSMLTQTVNNQENSFLYLS
jgi:hypothetical protein